LAWLADQPPALGRDERPRAEPGETSGNVDRRPFRPARIQFRDDLQDRPPGQRMNGRHRKGRMTEASHRSGGQCINLR